jgi:uncharacterized protein DUF1203
MSTARFTVSAISPLDLHRIRSRRQDDFGNPLAVRVSQGEEPLRCCLREASPGEQIALIAYRPADRGGPYAEVGPVFIHAERCVGYPNFTEYPVAFRHRRQLFRAYDEDGQQVHNQIVEPGCVDSALAELLDRPGVAFIHSRNVLAGCYMFTITPNVAAPVPAPVPSSRQLVHR